MIDIISFALILLSFTKTANKADRHNTLSK